MKTAILVDGGFYRKRARALWGDKKPEDRVKELFTYCLSHLSHNKQTFDLYRIFYYDCPPISKKIFHPFLKTTVDFGKSDIFKWTYELFEILKCQRKVALRLGNISEFSAQYCLRKERVKDLFGGSLSITDITKDDFEFKAQQKGVDMKIGIDIASLAYKKQVDQIVLISGDSDFVSAAKLARREGIDFILDPMWANIKPDLNEHIDGLWSPSKNPKDFEKKIA
jgi:uncharacterized LabA/DUF88 family protein